MMPACPPRSWLERLLHLTRSPAPHVRCSRNIARPLPHGPLTTHLLLPGLLTGLLIGLLPTTLRAEEGMWLPQQVGALEPELARLGIRVPPAELMGLQRGPAGAVVSLYGGTASFVSDQGLLLTNHHVAFDAIQEGSTPERDLLAQGFLARDRAQELPGTGYSAFVTQTMQDVTSQVLEAIPAEASDLARQEALELQRKILVAECEARPFKRCEVAVMDAGRQYLLIEGLELRDIRLVYAPPIGVGDFGGETDNFGWPRHAGDFSIMRAYVSPTGEPAGYSPNNVPYQPPRTLTRAAAPPQSGDPLLIFGYPYSTSRYEISAALAFQEELALPARVAYLSHYMSQLETAAASDRARAIRLAVQIADTGNGLTNTRRKLEPLRRSGIRLKRERQEAALKAWIAADPERQARWGAVLPGLEALVAEERAGFQRQQALSHLARAGELSRAALLLLQAADQLPRKDLDRRPEFQNRNLEQLGNGLAQLHAQADPGLERTLLEAALLEALSLPQEQRIPGLDARFRARDAAAQRKKIARQLERIFKRTTLAEPGVARKLLEAGSDAISRSRDPLLELVRTYAPAFEAQRAASDARSGKRQRLHPALIETMLAMEPTPHYPDANGTLRFTYGSIQGYSPGDGVSYAAFTTLEGVLEKNTGRPPFEAPQRLLRQIPGHETQPVDFVATVDTTGGNSGSPVLDRDGKLVGLLFDGNQESTADDFVFWQQRQRSICVDLRYIGWMLRTVEHAEGLLEELGW